MLNALDTRRDIDEDMTVVVLQKRGVVVQGGTNARIKRNSSYPSLNKKLCHISYDYPLKSPQKLYKRYANSTTLRSCDCVE